MVNNYKTMEEKRKGVYGKIDYNIVKEALAQGKTKIEAGKLAGSQAKDDRSVINTVNNKIMNDSAYKRDVIATIESRRKEALEAMTPEKASKASYQQLATSVGILTDKSLLLRGDPTSISMDKKQLVFYKETKADGSSKEIATNNPLLMKDSQH